MANLPKVMTALYCQPWLISPAAHSQLCEIARAHLEGIAHAADGIANQKQAEKHGPRPGIAGSEWWQRKDDWTGENVSNGVSWHNNVVRFDIGGVIGRRFSMMLNDSGVTSIDVLSRMLDDAEFDDRVSAVVLDLDTPGGTVTQVPEVAKQIAGYSKPVLAYTGGMMASAGYWLAVNAHEIWAAPSADIGSIGVYSAFLDRSRQFEMEGLKTELFKTGKYKGMGMPGLPLTDDQKALIQSEVDTIFGWFTAAVRNSRGKVADDTMQGQTFFGEEAKARNLVDRIGTITDAIERASQLTR
jgi:signal peptide peptidase SppA